MTEDSTSQLRS